MEYQKIEVTQDMLEQALLSCLNGEPTDHYPCEGCYLNPLRGADDDCMPDGDLCSKHLALDAIAYIRRINNFENSQCAHLLVRLEELQRQCDEINRYNISCTKKIDKLLVEKATLKESKKALENDIINANMNLEHEEEKETTFKKALDVAENKLTELTSYKSKGGWHDYILRQAQELESENDG